MRSVKETLEQIAATKAFDRLSAFTEPSSWVSLDEGDCELLAMLFIRHAEGQLKECYEKALELLSHARTVASKNVKVLLAQAKILSYHLPDHAPSLSLTHALLEEACSLDPTHEAHLALSATLLRLGVLKEDAADIEKAIEVLSQAVKCAKDEAVFASLQWRLGLCWFAVARLSGEACDYRLALTHMEKAALNISEAAFFCDYGKILSDYGNLFQHVDLFHRARHFFYEALKVDPTFDLAWFGIASVTSKIYYATAQKQFFTEAHQAYQRATAAVADLGDFWFGWGQLLVSYGKFHRDLGVLKEGLIKHEKAYKMAPNQLVVTCAFAEVQLLVGSYSERLDLMREAEQKALSCEKAAPENSRVFFLLASCFSHLGRYFEDPEYLNKAIEKFREGLALNPQDGLLWYGLSQTYAALGEGYRDVGVIRQALSGYAKAGEFGGNIQPQLFNDWGLSFLELFEITHEKVDLEAAVEKFELAIAHQIKALELEGSDLEGINVEWLYNYGCSFDLLGDVTLEPQHYEKAIRILSQLMLLAPTFLAGNHSLALAFIHLGEVTQDVECLQRAIEILESLIEQNGENEAALGDLGVAFISLSQLMKDPYRPDFAISILQQAEARLLQAAALGNNQTYYHLACTYSLMENTRASLYYLKRAELAETLPSLEELLQDEWLEGVRDTEEYREWIERFLDKKRDKDSFLA